MRVWLLRGALLLLASSCALGAQGLGDTLNRRAVKQLAPGKLLVATRNLPDPNFANTVVLLASFNKDGAMGLVVNRPTTVTLARLFPELDRTVASAGTVFQGGPVAGPGALALVRAATPPASARRIVGDVHLVNTRDVVEDLIAAGAQPNRFRVYLGYAGWSPGQLEEETSNGVWRIVDGDAEVIFDAEPDALWRRLILRTEALSAHSSALPSCPSALLPATSSTQSPRCVAHRRDARG